jgi:hypothetical protein
VRRFSGGVHVYTQFGACRRCCVTRVRPFARDAVFGMPADRNSGQAAHQREHSHGGDLELEVPSCALRADSG